MSFKALFTGTVYNTDNTVFVGIIEEVEPMLFKCHPGMRGRVDGTLFVNLRVSVLHSDFSVDIPAALVYDADNHTVRGIDKSTFDFMRELQQ